MAKPESFGLPKKSDAKYFWGCAFLSAVCLFWVIGGLPWFQDNLGAVIFGAIGALIFVPGTIALGRQMIRGSVAAIITEDGLELPSDFIEWSEISCLQTRTIWGRPWIQVVLRDSQAVVARQPLLRRLNMRVDTMLHKSQILINPESIDSPAIFLIMASSYVPIDYKDW